MGDDALETIPEACERYGIPYQPLYRMCLGGEVKATNTGEEWLIDVDAMRHQMEDGRIGLYRARGGKMGWHGDAAGSVVYSEPGMRLSVAVGSKDIRHNTRAVFYGYRWLGTGEDERRKFVGKLDDVEARWRDWAAKPLPGATVAETPRAVDSSAAAPEAAPRPQETPEEPGEAVGGSCTPGEAGTQQTPTDVAADAMPVVMPSASVSVGRAKKPFLYSVTYSRPDGGSTNVVAFTDEQKALSAAIEYGRVIEAIGVSGDFSVDEVPIGWD